MNRQTTPDVLGDLMGQAVKQESPESIKAESNKAIKLEGSKGIKLDSRKAVLKPLVKEVESSHEPLNSLEAKEKATFNLPKSVLEELEDVWIEIRRIRGDKRMSKTDIVERGIVAAIKEFRLKKGLSQLCCKQESNKAGKQ